MALIGVACTTVRPVSQPAEFIPKASPALVYVTLKNQSKVTLSRPHVSGDTLFGTVTGVASPLAAPLSHVEVVEAKQRDKGRTAWLIAGLTLAVAGGVWAVSQTGGGTTCDYSIPGTFVSEPSDNCY
jgi:hypothetical protein